MKKKFIKIMLAVLFLRFLVYPQIVMESCLYYEKIMNEKKKNCNWNLELSENYHFLLGISYKMIIEILYIFYKFQMPTVL